VAAHSRSKPAVRVALPKAREESATPTISVAAADFIGPHVRNSHASERMVPNILTGKSIQALGNVDLPHSFTYMPDLAAAMIRAAQDRTLWNTFLHAPTVSIRELVQLLADAAGKPAPKVMGIPGWALRGMGHRADARTGRDDLPVRTAVPVRLHRERGRLGLKPTPLPEVAAGTRCLAENRCHRGELDQPTPGIRCHSDGYRIGRLESVGNQM
jgi:nucleoside-diphosphate-sugar epimerase